ncbi:MAG: hypothetical protein JWQ30_2312 [Sediminibacterium sp.]|nr:hypothetical protein [Sediminibacterium sp.]
MRSAKNLLIIFLLFPVYLSAQVPGKSYADTGWAKVQGNIYRIVLTAPIFPDYETDGILSVQYERRLAKKITAVTQLGFGYTHDRFGPDEDPNRSTYHVFAALEARYYFSLDRRVRKMRPIVNYTGPYVSIASSVISNKVIAINPTPTKQFYGRVASYLDIGYQKQTGKFFLGAYFGILLWGKRFSDYDDYAAGLHGGLSVGYVF